MWSTTTFTTIKCGAFHSWFFLTLLNVFVSIAAWKVLLSRFNFYGCLKTHSSHFLANVVQMTTCKKIIAPLFSRLATSYLFFFFSTSKPTSKTVSHKYFDWLIWCFQRTVMYAETKREKEKTRRAVGQNYLNINQNFDRWERKSESVQHTCSLHGLMYVCTVCIACSHTNVPLKVRTMFVWVASHPGCVPVVQKILPEKLCKLLKNALNLKQCVGEGTLSSGTFCPC